jgi:hypothetical protein
MLAPDINTLVLLTVSPSRPSDDRTAAYEAGRFAARYFTIRARSGPASGSDGVASPLDAVDTSPDRATGLRR